MKIGILTFHYAYNYGAVLQAYASCCVLRERGHDVQIVDYVPGYFQPTAYHFRGLGFRNGAWRSALLERLTAMPRRLAFDRFRRRHLPMSARIRPCDLTELGTRYELFFVGSDQVWNLNWMHEFDGFYFCDFLPSNGQARAIAYAACFGTTGQPAERLAKAGSLMRKFSAIGTRNRMSANIAREVSGAEVDIVCDPTMLHDFRAIRRPQRREDYILVYSLDEGGLNVAQECCRILQDRSGSTPVWFVGNDRIAECEWADRVISTTDPADWMNLIADARAVVTDSFHGCIFAMKFGRTLRAYSSGWRAGRLIELFEAVGVPSTRVEDSGDTHWWRVDQDNREMKEAVQTAIADLASRGLAWLDAKIADADKH